MSDTGYAQCGSGWAEGPFQARTAVAALVTLASCGKRLPVFAALVASAGFAAAPLEYTGVNLAGAEFGEGTIPGTHGTHYIYPNQQEVDYYRGKDMNVIRLPFRWERLQRTLNGDFDSGELARLDRFVSETTAKGVHVILDPHNYARYHGNVVGSPELPNAAFADFWERLATLYKDNPRVIFGLMNEPHSMATETWLAAANAAVAAIRNTGATNLVLVPGNGYTGAHSWLSDWYGNPNGTVMGDVVDPAGNFAFEMHQYFDADSSGTSSDTVNDTIGSTRLKAATAWLRTNGHRGFLGEFGAYRDATGLSALDDILNYMESNSDVWMGYTYWAGGPWWGDYIFTLEPDSAGDRPQMTAIFPHTQIELPGATLQPSGQADFQSRGGYFYQLWVGEKPGALTPTGDAIEGTGALINSTAPGAAEAENLFIRLGVSKKNTE